MKYGEYLLDLYNRISDEHLKHFIQIFYQDRVSIKINWLEEKYINYLIQLLNIVILII